MQNGLLLCLMSSVGDGKCGDYCDRHHRQNFIQFFYRFFCRNFLFFSFYAVSSHFRCSAIFFCVEANILDPMFVYGSEKVDIGFCINFRRGRSCVVAKCMHVILRCSTFYTLLFSQFSKASKRTLIHTRFCFDDAKTVQSDGNKFADHFCVALLT